MTVSSLNKLNIGLVGISPGLLFLQTNLTNIQLQVPGALNSIVGASGVSVNNGDALIANAQDGGEYYTVIVAANGQITLKAAGGIIPEGFKYQNTYWLAKNGNDANDGLSIDSPLLTLAALQAKLVAGVTTVLNIVDDGVYVVSSTFTVPCALLINAPGATIHWTGSPGGIMFALNVNSPVVANIGLISASNALSIFRGFSSCVLTGPSGFCRIISNAGVRAWEDANTISGGVNPAIFNINTDRFGADFLFAFAGTQIVNAISLGDGNISSQLPSGVGNGVCKINANFWNGVASGTADFSIDLNHAGSSFGFTSSGVLNLNVATSDLDLTTIPFNGLVSSNPINPAYPENLFNNPLYFFQQPIIGELYSIIYEAPASPTVWSFTPGVQNGNTQISIPRNAANGSITIPAGSSVPYGWRIHYQQTVGSGARVQIFPGSNDTLNGQNSIGPGATSCFTGIGTGKFVRGAANGGGGFDWAVENCYTSN